MYNIKALFVAACKVSTAAGKIFSAVEYERADEKKFAGFY